MQDYLYSALSLVAIAIHLIINHDLFRLRQEVSNPISRSYRGFLVATLLYYITDVGWGVFAGLNWIGALYWETVLYFIALAFIVVEWCRFVVVYLNLHGWMAKLLRSLGYALLAYNIAVLTANFFNDCFFYFDAQGRYAVGFQRDLAFCFQLALNLLAAAFAFVKALGCHDTMRRRTMLVMVFGLTMTVAFGIQVIWPLLPFTALGCVIGNCIFRMFVIEDERDEFRKAIIEREQAKKHLKEMEVALERARAAEKTRSTFFSIVSHDIRTPLNAILGYSELLQNGIKTKAERSEALKSIRASGVALLQLVNDVLDLAKIDSGKMTIVREPVMLSQLVGDVVATFRLASETKGIELISRTNDVPMLMLDGSRLRQVLFNLVGNAVKFTQRGSVTITTSYDGTRATVAVADTGCGIPPDMLKSVFEPFVQIQDPTHPDLPQSGTGLGLSICKRFVEAMGGRLTVESEPWKGSTFSAIIPCEAADEQKLVPPATADEQKLVPPAQPKRVLVVDDSPVNRTVLKAFLKRANVPHVDLACDGRDALTMLRTALQEGKAHDFVFTDFWMPNINGLELIDKLRADPRFAKLPVFAVTADTELNSSSDERVKLFTGILFKPVTYDKLMEALAKAESGL